MAKKTIKKNGRKKLARGRRNAEVASTSARKLVPGYSVLDPDFDLKMMARTLRARVRMVAAP
jgi:hypothetical protein